MAHEEIEARVNAHRELLVGLLAAILSGRQDIFLAELEADICVADGQEDPGLEPISAFATETRMAEEIRAIVEAAKIRANVDR